ncbi:hypothetical protein LYNGBM3L_30910 [Moorena producens 3L]|uniref:Uncharacterized protein n=1 Tax=Moorena producens 3L TaxID=489825 RepID=F4XTQ6_9CYAN|nr:hypothetical protein LYNGBM3L_30910 [Moorena producens 3L]OLT67153.1 hypothetical protein BI334_20925 [Moorena producens 3L]
MITNGLVNNCIKVVGYKEHDAITLLGWGASYCPKAPGAAAQLVPQLRQSKPTLPNLDHLQRIHQIIIKTTTKRQKK